MGTPRSICSSPPPEAPRLGHRHACTPVAGRARRGRDMAITKDRMAELSNPEHAETLEARAKSVMLTRRFLAVMAHCLGCWPLPAPLVAAKA
jgi:hypothetical protein